LDESVKVCPRCGAEYFAHVASCNACKAALVFPGDLPQTPLPAEDDEEDLVCVEEGNLDMLAESLAALRKAGVRGSILKSGKTGSCSGSSGYGLFVGRSLARNAVKLIEENTERLYPGMKEAEARLDAGLCPACGADISGGPAECPDCGLSLAGGGGCGDDPSCGGHSCS
jgi:hypothetical protein